MDFEKKLKRLEEIVQKMEDGELALENSLEIFEEGIRLSRECQTQLTESEHKVQRLLRVEDNGTSVTEPLRGDQLSAEK